MRINELDGRRVYVWSGMAGGDSEAAMAFLNKKLPELTVGVIENDIVPDDAEIVIKDPDVSVYKDEYKNAAEKGVRFTNLLNIFFAELHAQEKRPTVIAVTGTKGKTTTAAMLAFILEKLEHKTGFGGNTPPLDFLERDLEYIVLELSSFQTTSLEYYPDYCQVVSISPSISPAHLDWHLNYENYKQDKLGFLKDGNVKSYLCGEDEFLKTLDLPNAKLYQKITSPSLPENIYGEHNVINLSGALEIIKDLGLDGNLALIKGKMNLILADRK